MINVPGLRGLEVGLTSRNEPTLGGRVIMSPVMDATAEASGLSVTFRLFDVFGLPCSGVRLVRGVVLQDGALADVAPILSSDVGSVAQDGMGFVGMTTGSGVLGLTAALGGYELALWLPNDVLIRSGVLIVEP